MISLKVLPPGHLLIGNFFVFEQGKAHGRALELNDFETGIQNAVQLIGIEHLGGGKVGNKHGDGSLGDGADITAVEQVAESGNAKIGMTVAPNLVDDEQIQADKRIKPAGIGRLPIFLIVTTAQEIDHTAVREVAGLLIELVARLDGGSFHGNGLAQARLAPEVQPTVPEGDQICKGGLHQDHRLGALEAGPIQELAFSFFDAQEGIPGGLQAFRAGVKLAKVGVVDAGVGAADKTHAAANGTIRSARCHCYSPGFFRSLPAL